MKEIANIIKIIKNWDYIRTSMLQRELSLGFVKATQMLNTLKELGLVSEKEEKDGFKVNKEKIDELLKEEDKTLEIRLEALLAKRKWLKEQLNK